MGEKLKQNVNLEEFWQAWLDSLVAVFEKNWFYRRIHKKRTDFPVYESGLSQNIRKVGVDLYLQNLIAPSSC